MGAAALEAVHTVEHEPRSGWATLRMGDGGYRAVDATAVMIAWYGRYGWATLRMGDGGYRAADATAVVIAWYGHGYGRRVQTRAADARQLS